MIVSVANPIYDSVFKYLMEDERIARTLLSALLRKEVVEVQTRRNEYTNGSRDNVSMFRIDFGAQVREADGSIHLVLIELQKTWLETETLRFRQYLGSQYSNPENMQKEGNQKGYGIPMVSVYLLGHRVGDIEEPVLYVHHKAYDYEGREVSKGMPDPFVESLIHDSIIVQIPLLRGQVNNRLEKVLSVFDQSALDGKNHQVLNIDEAEYANDSDMLYILHRLTAAASSSEMRQHMNVEDEFFSAIENRDTEIMMRDKRIKEQDGKIAEQNGKIAEQNGKIAEQNGKIAEQNGKIAEQNGKIAEQNGKIAEQESMMGKMIRRLLATGTPLEEIAKMTGQSIDAIRQLEAE